MSANYPAVRAFCSSAAIPALVAALAVAPPLAAFPGLMSSKGKPPVVHSTHVVVMKKGPTTVVSVMPDYQGSLEPFAMLLPVPADVTLESVVTLKREYVDHADQISAPRFHEFWEQDPCDEGPVEQEWQRNRKVSGSGFLGAPQPGFGEPPAARDPGARTGDRGARLHHRRRVRQRRYVLRARHLPGRGLRARRRR
jgi:hypothetical protein